MTNHIAVPSISAQGDLPLLVAEISTRKATEHRLWVDKNGKQSDILIDGTGLKVANGPLEAESVEFVPPSKLRINSSCTLVYPRKPLFNNKITSTLTTIDTNPDQSLIAVGEANGSIDILSIPESGELRRKLQGHPIYTSKVGFFPSGEVLMSTGADMTIRIWSVIDGSNPRSLVGHKAPVTGLEFIGRGRNIVSGDKAGKAILWELGSGSQISEYNVKQDIVGISIISSLNGTEVADPLLFDTSDKCLAIASTSQAWLYDIRSGPTEPFASVQSEKISAIGALGNHIAIGQQDGVVQVYDSRNLGNPVVSLSKETDKSSIKSIQFKKSHSVSVLDESCVFTVDLKNNAVDYCIQDGAPLDMTQGSQYLVTSGKFGEVNVF